MENLITVLDSICEEYDNLLELSTKKKPAIISGNLEDLSKITDEEQIVASRISNLDNKRREVIQDIANVVNRDVEDLILTNIIQMLEPRPVEQQKLAKVHDRLSVHVRHIMRRGIHRILARLQSRCPYI